MAETIIVSVDNSATVSINYVEAPAIGVSVSSEPVVGFEVGGLPGPPGSSVHGDLSELDQDQHQQYAIIEVTDIEPVSPRVGVIWVPEG